MSMARRTSSRRSAASSASTIFRSSPLQRQHPIAAAHSEAAAETHAGGKARARLARLQRGGHLVVHSEAQAKLFGGGQPELKLANPISSELTDMRPSLLPNLIAAAGRNMARGFADLALFEVGPCLWRRQAGG